MGNINRRELFALPEGIIYMDGNSLGALPRAVVERTRKVVAEEWGRDLITAWNRHDWIDLPRRIGEKIAPLIGAAPGTVMVADSTSLNLFKLLAVALERRPDRKVILTEAGNFPTDIYMAEGLARLTGHEVRAVPAGEIEASLGPDVAVLMLTEVNYRTGEKLETTRIMHGAFQANVLTLLDLAHSAGAMPVDLAGAGVDFAVGCGYKYLNGGPGAPAFAYVAPKHHDGLRTPLSGWLGHEAPFAFAPDYQPAAGVDALRVGTPPIISMSALDAALDVFDGVAMAEVKREADVLFDIFTARVLAATDEVTLLTPRDPARRGTQVSLRHPHAYAVMQALIARGVIGDFRQPDILRFGLTPLYLTREDVGRAADVLVEVLASREWDRPEYRQRAKVV